MRETEITIREINGVKWAVADAWIAQGDIQKNTKTILNAIQKARQKGAHAVLFCELATTGYFVADAFLALDFQQEAYAANEQVAHAAEGIAVIWGGLADSGAAKPYNAALVAVDGRIIHTQPKCLLPTYGEFSDARYFTPGPLPEPISLLGQRLGLTICEDIWDENYAQKPLNSLSGCDVLGHLAAVPWTKNKPEIFAKAKQKAAARAPGEWLVASMRGVGNTGKSYHFMLGNAWEGTAVRQTIIAVLRAFWAPHAGKSAIIGLSGGVDSAVVACLGAAALGPERVTAVHMPGPYTSARATKDAKTLAKSLHIAYKEIPLEPFLEPYSAHLPSENLAYENLQARTRGGVLAHIAARDSGLILNTGNKTEIGLGYSTLYGDMVGAIAPIGDLLKGEVYALAKEFPAISDSILAAPPSAELAPDQVDPFDYPFYDALIRAFTEQKHHANELLLREKNTLASCLDIPAKAIPAGHKAMIQDAWARLTQSAFKRVQAPPVIALTQAPFGGSFREYIR